MRHEQLGPGIREQQLQPYPPMPPLLGEQLPDGRTERTIAVGLLPIKGEHHHEIVGVNMSRRTIIRFENHAPSSAQAHNTRFADFLTPTRPPRATSLVRSGSLSNREAPRFGSSLPFDPAPRLGPMDRAWNWDLWTIAASACFTTAIIWSRTALGRCASIALKSSQVTRYRWSFPHTI